MLPAIYAAEKMCTKIMEGNRTAPDAKERFELRLWIRFMALLYFGIREMARRFVGLS
jgi:hypothetical protein